MLKSAHGARRELHTANVDPEPILGIESDTEKSERRCQPIVPTSIRLRIQPPFYMLMNRTNCLSQRREEPGGELALFSLKSS